MKGIFMQDWKCFLKGDSFEITNDKEGNLVIQGGGREGKLKTDRGQDLFWREQGKLWAELEYEKS